MTAISRRRLLAATPGLAAVGLAAGCADATSPPVQEAPPATSVLEPVAAAESGLIALYDATIAAFPVLATALTPLRDQHVDHRTAASGAAQSADAPNPAPAPAVASTASGALRALRDAERQAARDRRASCLAASDPASVRMLALIAASEASHLPVLRKLEPA